MALILLGAWWLRSKPANDALAQGWRLGGGQAVLEGPTMGTRFRVVVVDMELEDAPAVRDAVVNALAAVNASMSTYDPDSEVSRFNVHRSSDPFSCSPELREVVRMATSVSETSGGAFDVTVAPLVNALGFGPTQGLVASTEDRHDTLDALAMDVGYGQLSVTPQGLRKSRPDLQIDLSAIAKGYGVDRVALALDARGLGRYLVEVGGEVRARGTNATGIPWRVGIERPGSAAGAETGGSGVFQVVSLTDMSMATSGDYRNYREQDGERLSHTVDPRLGRSVTHALTSVSVLHAEAAYADAYATALNVLGPDAGFELATREGLAAYFIVRGPGGPEDLDARWTSAFARYIPEP